MRILHEGIKDNRYCSAPTAVTSVNANVNNPISRAWHVAPQVDETNVIRGALDLTSKTASRAMTPLDKAFMLSTAEVLSEATLRAILDSGHSRIPVYKGGPVIAYLFLTYWPKAMVSCDRLEVMTWLVHIKAARPPPLFYIATEHVGARFGTVSIFNHLFHVQKLQNSFRQRPHQHHRPDTGEGAPEAQLCAGAGARGRPAAAAAAARACVHAHV